MVLLEETEPENASAPPTRKARPVSANKILEKNPKATISKKVNPKMGKMINIMRLTPHKIRLPLRIHRICLLLSGLLI